VADLYALLEVEPTATQEGLKRSYRRLARELHPDANPGDAAAEARFKEVSQAYEILSDPRAPGELRPLRRRPDGRSGCRPVPSKISSTSSSARWGAWGEWVTPSAAQAGPDAEVVLDLTLDEAAFGVTRDVSVNVPVRCEECDGYGTAPGTSASTCSECQGTGEVRRVRDSLLGQMVMASPCHRCPVRVS
jgi:molecular chaperone DnaJ